MSFDDQTTGGPVDPRRERVHDTNYVLNELKRLQLDSTDAFGNSVAARTNVLDVAAHYPYNPERHRLFVDGSRVFPEYTTVSQYTHATDVHRLQPAAGETVTFRSTERPRYVVQYELAATWAFGVNQSLQSGDSVRIGLYDGTDGWYMEHSGDQADDVADFVAERAGSEIYRETDVDIRLPVTTFGRLKLTTGWYRITRQLWDRSFQETVSDAGVLQRNKRIIAAGSVNQQGPVTGNLPSYFSVTASGSTTGLELDAGSFAQVNLGETTALNRTKLADFKSQSINETGTWEPLTAIRVDPDREIINVQLSQLRIHEYSANDDVHLLAMAHAPSKVLDSTGSELTDSDYSTPVEQTSRNSVIEETTAVDQAPDDSGTPTTSSDTPGGYQLTHVSLHTSGQGSKTMKTSSDATVKRGITAGDVVVFWGLSDTLGDITFEYSTEQDW